MTKPLVVVESPTKVRTLQKYLGKDYRIAATVGHIKDLPQKDIGIDIENNFKPTYTTIPGKQKVIRALRQAADNAQQVYLAPDPDREGEAIAWHAADILKKKGRQFYRVLFHELTQNAIKDAIAAPTELNRSKFEAQQARRILDRLVGYLISPLLWRKVKSGLSAGRVQSVAVRIICERERAIQAFEPEEYWSITAHLAAALPPPFTAKLVKKSQKKIKIHCAEEARAIVQELDSTDFNVARIRQKTTRKNPQPPFVTSKLQQEAINKLRFSAKKTMMIAQQLYEGVDLGPGEPVGLITYMRTDSTRISQEAAREALALIHEEFGADYAEDKPRFFKNRKKAQDAHEAIRPTSVRHTPEKVAPYLKEDQLALYRLIWQRFVASQMKPALIDQKTIAIQAGDYEFSTTGSTVKFPGFMKLYRSVEDEAGEKQDASKAQLPTLTQGEGLQLHQLAPKQHFTQPPPRFSEASLVKELEENGIGRPSTYAAILSTIQEKGYVERIKGYFTPSELGLLVNDLLVESFPDILEVAFTAKMEEYLDQVETSEAAAVEVLKRFYDSLEKELGQATQGMRSLKAVGVPTGLKCPACGKELHIKMGRNGHFLACSGYPECTYSCNYTRDEKGRVAAVETAADELTDHKCERCGRPMVKKEGKYGPFLACSGYPECKNTQSLGNGGKDTGVRCPEPGCDGTLVEKKSKRGKTFYGCNRYPKCTYALWDKPVPHPCPNCQAPFLVEKTTKKKGTYYKCLTPGCGYETNELPEGE